MISGDKKKHKKKQCRKKFFIYETTSILIPEGNIRISLRTEGFERFIKERLYGHVVIYKYLGMRYVLLDDAVIEEVA